MSDFWYLGLLVVVIFLMTPTITFIHEMGHAIPALIFTPKSTIEIFVNCYSAEEQTINFRIGRLHFFIKYNYNLFIPRGFCRSSEQLSTFSQKIIFQFGGPIINLVTAFIAFCCIYFFVNNKFIFFLGCFFIYTSTFMFFINLIPRTITLQNGKKLTTDGKKILDLFTQRQINVHIKKGDIHLKNNDYLLALNEFKKSFRLGVNPIKISSTLSTIYIQLNKYNEVEQLLFPKIENNTADINDFYFIAYAAIMKNDFEKAISFARKALEIDNSNQPTLNLLGYCLIETNNLVEAENVLLKALDDEQSKSYALNNLGYIKIIQDKLEEGFLLIEQSLQLNTTNGYAYRNRGIYHFKKEQFALAKIDFEKANEIEPDVLHLDEWMQQLQYKLNETQLKSN